MSPRLTFTQFSKPLLIRNTVQIQEESPTEVMKRRQGTAPLKPTQMGSEEGLSQKQRAPRRRCQQPKMLSSPEDTMYYNQLNGTLEYQGSQRKPRKLGQIKVLDGEDQYYKCLSPGACAPEETHSVHPFFFSSSPREDPFAQH